MSFIAELKRRNVVKVAVLYVVAAWLLLQVADVLSSLLPVPDWTGSLVFILLVLGFPPAIIFSWVYEITPEGIRREKDVDRSQSITPETGRKINILMIVLLIVAIAVMIVTRVWQPATPGPAVAVTGAPEGTTAPDEGGQETGSLTPGIPPLSIAVLPFVNMSSDPEQEYFSDGLSEELLNLLTQVPELTVASRTSAFSFKGKEATVGEIAAALNVAHILEGSVRKSGNQIRITAQLIDTTRDVHLWSETWDRQMGDVFVIQDEIAAAVTDQLKVTLLGHGPEAAETDPETYNLYLRARHLERQGSKEGMSQAVDLYEKALGIDPEYAPAWVGLAVAYTNMAGTRTIDRDEGYAEAKAATDQALAVDPDNAEALAILGWIARQFDGDFAKSADYYRKALALAPNNIRVLNGSAVLLQDLGRIDESLRVYRELARRDPLSTTAHHNLAIGYFAAGDLEAAKAQLDEALTLSPDMILARIWRARIYAMQGEYQQALDAFNAVADLTGDEGYRLAAEAGNFPEMGRTEEGDRALEELERDYGKEFTGPIIVFNLRRGNVDRAIDWLEKGAEWYGPSGLTFVKFDPAVAALRDQPRVQALLEKYGLTDAQLAKIEFQVQVPD
jgi:adenylate cyclase